MTENIIQFVRPTGYVVRYQELKGFPAIEDGSYIAVARGSGPHGETYAVILNCPANKDQPFEVLQEFNLTEASVRTAEFFAEIADTTLGAYIMLLPEPQPAV